MEKETFKKLLRIILKDRVSDEIISDIMFLFDEFTHGQTPVDIESLKKDIFNEMQNFNKMPQSLPYYPAVSPAPAIPTIYADVCSCNPKNGGSGICGCTIGNKLLPEPNQSNTYTQTSWISTPTFNDPSTTKK